MARGRAILFSSAAAALLCAIASAALVANTLEVRYERDVSRMVFNDNVELLDELHRRAGIETDSLRRLIDARPEPASRAYIVVSIEDHRLWYRHGDSVLFTTPVATGSGKILESTGSVSRWRFETPRGRLVVISRDTNPVWIPPDWYYVEEAVRRGLGIVRLTRGQPLFGPGGQTLSVVGTEVVRRVKNGKPTPVPASEGKEIVFGGNLVIPPFGTSQRKYLGVLGTHRLNLGDGYALHGTNKPETIGRSVSHGCVRLRNEDVAWLYGNVPIGTPVYIY
ncbi:MAG TPA: L,D-transpeptidase [Gemmatimonadaceae bacterium]